MEIKIPEFSLVFLIGVSGSGKSTFAKKQFKTTEVLSSDFFRGLVSDSENEQAATKDAFEALHFIAAKRLSLMRLTVIDATNLQKESRAPLLRLAKDYHCISVAIIFDLDAKICAERNASRPDRGFGPHVLRNQQSQLRRSIRFLKNEGFRYIHNLETPDQVEQATISRQKLWTDKRDEAGPFDIIGDVHGCYDELRSLLEKLGYEIDDKLVHTEKCAVRHSGGRRAIFLGDLVDCGPGIAETLALVMNMVTHAVALCVPGNHEVKLLKHLRGKDVQIKHGLAETIAQLETQPAEFRDKVKEFIDGLISHYILDHGKLVVAHAGMKESMQGRASGRVREFALYGETTGETDEFGLPVRYNWAAEYRGKSIVVYGHSPVPQAEWLNHTICIDTGCVFGGKLTALRYPERELVSVPAAKIYYESIKPLKLPAESELSLQHETDDLLDIEDVQGKRIITTRLSHSVTIQEENAAAALEVMSRWAVNPKWIIYLPPTMSPTETTKEEGLLEHPAEALSYFKKQKVASVICEEKHMGSRGIFVLCRTEEVARARFGVDGEGIGVCYTRTGRPFFDKPMEKAICSRIAEALDESQVWDLLKTDWICLDCEIMPWSLKARELLKSQYAAVGSSGKQAISQAIAALKAGLASGLDLGALLASYEQKSKSVDAFVESYRKYCWDCEDMAGIRIAPFHILASEGAVHTDKSHLWHMETIGRNIAKLTLIFFFKLVFELLPCKTKMKSLTRSPGGMRLLWMAEREWL